MSLNPRRTVRVFVSSTFKDMHAERDHLVTVVFPELRERCERLGVEFFDVDLRWGVPEKNVDGEKANSWEFCRRWIEKVEPLFVCILGHRYGWVPEPADLLKVEEQELQQKESRSVTEMEIRHAFEHEPERRQSFFYLRETKAPAESGVFVDEDLSHVESLREIILDRARQRSRPVHAYSCQWTGDGFTALEDFGRLVLDDLWSAILRDERYMPANVWREVLGDGYAVDPLYNRALKPLPPELCERIVREFARQTAPENPLEAERNAMQRFADSRLRWFQGRNRELDELRHFIRSDAEGASRLAVVAAAAGQGKSALMAKLHAALATAPGTHGITHFVGASERSSNTRELVKRLVEELDASGLVAAEEDDYGEAAKQDYNSLVQRLAQQLGGYCGEKRLVLLIDALNQLGDGHDLAWLPRQLGPSVRLVVSCIDSSYASSPDDETVMAALCARSPSPWRISLGGLTNDDIRVIVKELLEEHCKVLDREHIDAICAVPQAPNPLYLLVMLTELSAMGGDDMHRKVPELIAALPEEHPDTASLFKWVLRRMEEAEDFGREAVKAWCLYLALGRAGMSSRELADLLERKLGQRHTAFRIERWLRAYLQHRGEQMDFFHGQLRQAVMEYYGDKEVILEAHEAIADYFHDVANPTKSGPWKKNETHALRDLPYHQIQANIWPELVAALENIFFLEAKVAAGMIFDLTADLNAACDALPLQNPDRRRLILINEAIRRDIHFIARHEADYPQGLFQSLWNSCWWFDCPEVGFHYENGEAPHSSLPPERKLSSLLDFWRNQLETLQSPRPWLRSLRPPETHLGIGMSLVLRAGDSEPTFVDTSYSGNMIAAGYKSGHVHVWQGTTGRQTTKFEADDQVCMVLFSKDDSRVAVLTATGTLWVVPLSAGAPPVRCIGKHDPAAGCAWINSNEVLTISPDSEVQFSNLDRNETSKIFRLPGSSRFNRVSSPKNRPSVIQVFVSEFRVWSIDSGFHSASTVVDAEAKNCSFVAMNADLHRLAATIPNSNFSNDVVLWDIDTGRRLQNWQLYSCANHLAFSDDGTLLAASTAPEVIVVPPCYGGINIAGTPKGGLTIWDTITGLIVKRIDGHSGAVNGSAFLPSGKTIVSCASDKIVRFWTISESGQARRLRYDSMNQPTGADGLGAGEFNTVAISDDGRYVQTTELSAVQSFNDDGSFGGQVNIRIWDAASGREVSSATSIFSKKPVRFQILANSCETSVIDFVSGNVAATVPNSFLQAVVHSNKPLLAGITKVHVYIFVCENSDQWAK